MNFQENIQKKLIAWACGVEPKVLGLYGFGSAFAKNRLKHEDIDVAILCSRPLKDLERWKLQEILAAQLRENVDLIDLHQASLVMKHQIISEGYRFYAQPESACNAFETYVHSAYCRFNEERKEILKEILSWGKVYS